MITSTLTRDNVEMPIKNGLDFLRRADGSLIIGNRANAQKIADRMARLETAKTLYRWYGCIWSGNAYHRVSIAGQPQHNFA